MRHGAGIARCVCELIITIMMSEYGVMPVISSFVAFTEVDGESSQSRINLRLPASTANPTGYSRRANGRPNTKPNFDLLRRSALVRAFSHLLGSWRKRTQGWLGQNPPLQRLSWNWEAPFTIIYLLVGL